MIKLSKTTTNFSNLFVKNRFCSIQQFRSFSFNLRDRSEKGFTKDSFISTSKYLKNISNPSGLDDIKVSNRKAFKDIKPEANIIEILDQEGLGSVRIGKYTKVPPKPIRRNKIKFKPFKFFAGAINEESLPQETLKEIAFIGRSNVGKSTLINVLGSTAVARVSDKPGATQQINFYNSGSEFVLVDMPGYGFAYANDNKIEAWNKLIETYIKNRKSLKRLMVMIDARHGIKKKDQEFLNDMER
ncbi:hypothetical protein BB558_001551 [Smittium angustum]|uniref:EngB-type G domain-containing protein n=2 Tax=Harpellales TaxID=61421 RepID=A0A2U1JB22_SMIAN|nr:hypothetical protein BB558_001551 [Smittium angustum]